MGGPNTLSTESKVRRIHLSGLAPSVTAKDLVDRFSGFGNGVVGGTDAVGGLGLHANGAPRTFAFLTMDISDKDFNKCVSMLSGSMWKGHKLRIQPAKPDFNDRLAAEREAAREEAENPKPRKKAKRNPDPLVGNNAKHFELVTVDNIKKHRGWTLDDKPHPAPLFPLIARPSHPLPPVPKAAVTSWTRSETTKAKASKAARAAARAGVSLDQPLTRARRVRIDPRRWGRQHLVFTSEEVGAGWEGRRGVWECVERGEEEAAGAEEVEWVFRTKDGVVRRREAVRLTKKERSDNFTRLLDRMIRPEDGLAPKPAPAKAEVKGSACAAEPTTFEIDDIFDSAPILADKRVAVLAEEDASTDEEGITPIRVRAKSLSPPPFVAEAPRALLYTEDDAYHLLAATQMDDEVLVAREEERQKQLRMLQALLGAEVADVGAAAKAGPVVEGFAGEESDDEEVFQKAMQLRGGAASSSDDDSDSSSDSDDEDEGDKMAVEEPGSAAADPAKHTLEKGKLTDMFKPQEKEAAASFSMFADLEGELDLEELEKTPEPEPKPVHRFAPVAAAPVHPSRQAAAANARAWQGQGPVPNFFLTAEEADKAAEGFWRSEGAEEIEKRHGELREALRGVARKRHREGVKRSKGKVYGGGGGGGGGKGRGELEGREA